MHPSPDELIAIAHQSARRLWLHYGMPPWSQEDLEDYAQEAVEDLLRLLADPRYPNPSRGLLYATAKNAIRRARRWRVVAHNPLDTVDLDTCDEVEIAGPDETDEPGDPLSPLVAEGVLDLLLSARAPKARQAERTRRAARQDVSILALIIQRYSNDGIALELGLSRAAVDQRRRRLKDALCQAARRLGLSEAELDAIRPAGRRAA